MMIVQCITQARNAAVMVAQTKNEIRDVSGIRNSPALQLGRQKGGYGDPVFGSVQLRDKLFQKLQQQQAYAEKCYEKMIAALDTIADPVTRKLFYDRYYLNYSWERAAENVGIGVSAAKMRHKRYLEQLNTVSITT